MNNVIKKIFRVSIVKTIRFNKFYFGWRGVINPRIFISKNTHIEKLEGNIVLNSQKGRIFIGFTEAGIFDKKYERSIWYNTGQIVFKGDAHFGQGSRISNSGTLTFGNNFNIRANSTIVCTKYIEFGNDCLLSWDILIMDTDFHKIYMLNDIEKKQINLPEAIKIGDKCWIGCRSLILKGVKILPGTIVAANSTITSSSHNESNVVISSKGVIKKDVVWES